MSTISPDRVRHEIERVFREERAGEMIEMAGRLGVLAAIHPALRADPVTLRAIKSDPQNHARKGELLLGSMVQAAAGHDVEPIIGRLNLNSDWAQVVRDVARVRERLPELEEDEVTRSRVYRQLHGHDLRAVESCALAASHPKVAKWLRLYLEELRHVRPLLNGDDLMALGVREGPEVGLLLAELLDARLDGGVVTLEGEEDLVRQALRE